VSAYQKVADHPACSEQAGSDGAHCDPELRCDLALVHIVEVEQLEGLPIRFREVVQDHQDVSAAECVEELGPLLVVMVVASAAAWRSRRLGDLDVSPPADLFPSSSIGEHVTQDGEQPREQIRFLSEPVPTPDGSLERLLHQVERVRAAALQIQRASVQGSMVNVQVAANDIATGLVGLDSCLDL
jgi:hypothetical protein